MLKHTNWSMYYTFHLTFKRSVFYSAEACFRGHLNNTFYVRACLSPDDQYLMSGSSDNNALVWRVDRPWASPMALKGHCSEVSTVAWCPVDLAKCVTSSDDGTLRIWRSLRQEDTPDIGEVVGRTERTHKEIGEYKVLCTFEIEVTGILLYWLLLYFALWH